MWMKPGTYKLTHRWGSNNYAVMKMHGYNQWALHTANPTPPAHVNTGLEQVLQVYHVGNKRQENSHLLPCLWREPVWSVEMHLF